jgi:hypothetical protein
MKTRTLPPDLEKYSVALDHFPDFAAQVGILVSCFAILESYAQKLIARIAAIDENDAFVIAGSFQSFSARIDLFELLMNRRDISLPDVKAAKYFISGIREATALRNTYAHGTYSLTFEGGSATPGAKMIMHINSFLYDAKRKSPKKLIRDLEGAQSDVQALKALICELHGFLHRNEFPAQ